MSELIKIEERNGEQLVSGRELHKFLGIKTKYKDWFPRMCEYGFIENVDFVAITKERVTAQGNKTTFTDHMLTLEMAKEICYKSKRNPLVQEALKTLGVDIEQIHTNTRFEISFGNMLKEALDELELEVTEQYNVDGYRIDFYIPKLNIAVEYDEQQHFTEANHKKDLERQKYIENKLCCKFIRCDYRDSDIKNCMKVIKTIMKG